MARPKKTEPSPKDQKKIAIFIDAITPDPDTLAFNSLTVALDLAEIPPTTYRYWKKKYPEFLASIKKAMAEIEKMCVSNIAAGHNNWQGSAWILERYKELKGNWRRDIVSEDAGSATINVMTAKRPLNVDKL